MLYFEYFEILKIHIAYSNFSNYWVILCFESLIFSRSLFNDEKVPVLPWEQQPAGAPAPVTRVLEEAPAEPAGSSNVGLIIGTAR